MGNSFKPKPSFKGNHNKGGEGKGSKGYIVVKEGSNKKMSERAREAARGENVR